MRFPKPAFDDLVASDETDPETVHDCPRIHTRNPVDIHTCAIRITEALVIANGLIENRVKIPGYSGQGHMDVWNRTAPVGHACWDSQKVLFWKVE
jgi:hypothetical protein